MPLRNKNVSLVSKKFPAIYANIADYVKKFGSIIKSKDVESYEKLMDMLAAARAGKYEGGAPKLVADFKQFKGEITEARKDVETFGEKVRRIFSDKYVYGVIAVAAMYARRLVREVYQNVQEIDNAMTQLSIVTGQTGGELEASFDRAANSAKKLGSSITITAAGSLRASAAVPRGTLRSAG